MGPEKSPSSGEGTSLSREEILARIKAIMEADEASEETTKSRGHMAAEAAGVGSDAKDTHEAPTPSAPEKESGAIRAEAEGKGKKDSNFKKFLGAVIATSAALTAVGLLAGGVFTSKNNPNNAPTNPSLPTQTESIQENNETEKNWNDLTGYEAFDSRIDGSFTQYDNPGCFNSENKFSPTSVANPAEALALIGKDMETATPDEMGAAFEFVAYSQEETAAFIATAHNMAGFEGLSYQEAGEKIHNMTATEKQDFQNQLKAIFNTTIYSFGETNGDSTNFYMNKDENGDVKGFINTIEANGVKTLVMEHVNEDGSRTVANAMVRCFNGNQIIIVVNSDGGSYEITIPVDPPTPTPTPTPTPEPTPEPTPAPKDYENMERIDNQILDDIAEDVGSEQVTVTPSPEVSQADLTEQSSASDYEGTAPTIVENQAAAEATPVQEQVTAPANDYSQNLGGANQNEYAPVQENQAAQQAADEAETAIADAPDGGTELDDILSELGIE